MPCESTRKHTLSYLLALEYSCQLRKAVCCLQTKDELAQAIMTAIRKHLGRQQHSALEKAILQLVSLGGTHRLVVTKERYTEQSSRSKIGFSGTEWNAL